MIVSGENSFSPSSPMPEPSVKPKMYLVSISRYASSARAAEIKDIPAQASAKDRTAADTADRTALPALLTPGRVPSMGSTTVLQFAGFKARQPKATLPSVPEYCADKDQFQGCQQTTTRLESL